MAVRGIIGAFSTNARPDLFPDDALMSWYDNIHIPDVIATSGMKTALRYEALDPNAKYSWLVVYPVKDINFAGTEEFDNIPKGGHEEIDAHQFTDLAQLDLRIGARIQVFEPPSATKGRSSYLLAESINIPSEDVAQFDRWYNAEFLPALTKMSSFRRATRYNVVQSLVPGGPKHLVFYEFDTAEIPMDQIQRGRQNPKAQEVLKSATVEDVGYKLVKEAGVLDESL
ncbi:uncharacterized protein A1O5_05631 [Cladophialophora psammophila CBS 110553]|uniref:EthD domain-containing protein n=1 Tax=Cladophialophora psammophila CBS 110553 TaxID=1182543 RepID=W9X4F8_9EURO|nr:uncharacterized protein A1O5_05631 [Cladophialophora psammophila CBS 110553]EXJ71821.1 hypothetical protein A1O5_05631 [Cladophialophora psammophila CBS 110553]